LLLVLSSQKKQTSKNKTLSEQDKSKLLDFLKRSHGVQDESRITVTRKQTSEIHTAGGTVRVETRKKRVVVRPDEPVAAAEASREVAAAPVVAPAAPVAAVEPAATAVVVAAPAPQPSAAEVKAEPEAKPAVDVKPVAAVIAPEVKEPAKEPAIVPRVQRPMASILSPEEIASREAEERRQVQFRERQAALMREKIEREERRQAAARSAAAAGSRAVRRRCQNPEAGRGSDWRPICRPVAAPSREQPVRIGATDRCNRDACTGFEREQCRRGRPTACQPAAGDPAASQRERVARPS